MTKLSNSARSGGSPHNNDPSMYKNKIIRTRQVLFLFLSFYVTVPHAVIKSQREQPIATTSLRHFLRSGHLRDETPRRQRPALRLSRHPAVTAAWQMRRCVWQMTDITTTRRVGL